MNYNYVVAVTSIDWLCAACYLAVSFATLNKTMIPQPAYVRHNLYQLTTQLLAINKLTCLSASLLCQSPLYLLQTCTYISFYFTKFYS